jgi:hypothetical protein
MTHLSSKLLRGFVQWQRMMRHCSQTRKLQLARGTVLAAQHIDAALPLPRHIGE